VRLFPDDFRMIVPEHAMAAIMTCVSIGLSLPYAFSKKSHKIYNCINEYHSGEHVKSFFSGDNYQHAYKGILQIIALVYRSLAHKQQWE
jgi:hypothetical protein